MKAFVTGGTGFIGSQLITKLVDQGYQVHALVRSEEDAHAFLNEGIHPVRGDILDVPSMVDGMTGSDVVFHVAGWYKIGVRDKSLAEPVNVDGTRNVLDLAHKLNIPKIIHTSTVGVFGDTNGRIVDETYIMPPYQDFLTEYDRTKWKAHYEVALPMIRRGAPIMIAIPGGVYGPGDPSLIGSLMQLYYQGLMPVVFGPGFMITYAHVDDIADGLIRIAERGKIGESYILAGPAFSLGDMINLWAQLLNRKPPSVRIPARFLQPLIPFVGVIDQFIPLPDIISQDSLTILDATYGARADKAHRELDWHTRPIQQGMLETFSWLSKTGRTLTLTNQERRRIAAWSLGLAVTLLALWLRNQKGKSDNLD
jgi:dihydroflavonol-4-reductase